MANKNTEKGLGSKGLRAYSPGAEVKYIGIRAGSSKTIQIPSRGSSFLFYRNCFWSSVLISKETH